MMLILAPLAFAAALAAPAPAPQTPPAIPFAYEAPVDDLSNVPLTTVVLAASEVDLSQRMNDLGLVGSTGLFGAPAQLQSATASTDCPR